MYLRSIHQFHLCHLPNNKEEQKAADAQSGKVPDDYDQEIRFAIVMYGGVSLAIYIHGVAQELLRLVRATSGAELQGNEVAEIYREMSPLVRDQHDLAQRCRTRFIIDILSGTSAGGISTIFLAKALAVRSQNLERLRQTWLGARGESRGAVGERHST